MTTFASLLRLLPLMAVATVSFCAAAVGCAGIREDAVTTEDPVRNARGGGGYGYGDGYGDHGYDYGYGYGYGSGYGYALCTPGSYVFCRCADRSEGTKMCNADGMSYDVCACP
jgi:hypothetical protein